MTNSHRQGYATDCHLNDKTNNFMHDLEPMQAELKKVLDRADMQRHFTKWTLILVTGFIPALIVFGFLMAHRLKANIEDIVLAVLFITTGIAGVVIGAWQIVRYRRSATAETLKQTITQAFAEVPCPGDDRIAKCSRPECDECAGIRWGLKGRTPSFMSPYILEYHHASLPLLFPEAFHYFVPMYMRYAVKHPDSDVAAYTRYNLGESNYDEHNLKRFCLFNAQQREAVIAFLEFLKAQKIEGDDQDQRAYEDKISDTIWIWKDLRRFPLLASMSDDQIRELYQKQRKTVQSTATSGSAPARHPRC